MGFQRAGRYDQQGERVADQPDQRLVLEQVRIGAEDRRILRVFDMAFQRHGAFVLEQLHALRGQRDGIDMVLLGMLRPLEDDLHGPADGLQPVHGIAGDQRADRGAADDQHFVRHGLHDGTQRTARQREAAEDHDQQDDYADCRKHFEFLSDRAAISAASRIGKGWRGERNSPGSLPEWSGFPGAASWSPRYPRRPRRRVLRQYALRCFRADPTSGRSS